MNNSLRRIFVPAFMLVCLTLAAVPAMAWDDVGHKITAYIAWQRMTPQARENVIRILREAPEDSNLAAYYMSGPETEETRKREFFEVVATWADIVRDRDFETRYKKYHKGTWHYADTFWRQINGKVEPVTVTEEGGQAINRLVAFDKVIRGDASVSDKEKAIAIAWIMHLGGDIHQPLHTSARVTDLEPKGDQGGNLFLLTPQGTARADQLNLHWLWDSIVVRVNPLKSDQSGRQYVESMADRMMKKYPFAKAQNRLELGQYDAWQKESFAFNNTDVFSADLKRFESPSDKYKRNAYRVAEQQLTMAGYRLGETMNAVFNVAPPAPAGRPNP